MGKMCKDEDNGNDDDDDDDDDDGYDINNIKMLLIRKITLEIIRPS